LARHKRPASGSAGAVEPPRTRALQRYARLCADASGRPATIPADAPATSRAGLQTEVGEDTMAARTGQQFLDRLRKTNRTVWLGDDRVDDVTTHPELAAPRTRWRRVRPSAPVSRGVPDPDPETGEPINISHMFPRSVEDLKRRNRDCRESPRRRGAHGRTPDYMNVKFACFAARHAIWAGADQDNEEGAQNLSSSSGVWPRGHLTHAHHHPAHDRQGE